MWARRASESRVSGGGAFQTTRERGGSLRFVLLDADLEAAAAASSRRRTTLELPEGHDPDGRSAASVLEDWAAKRLRRLVRGLAQGCGVRLLVCRWSASGRLRAPASIMKAYPRASVA